jgi:FkbM family methyltransferase
MNLKQLPHKIINTLLNHTFTILGRDRISGIKIDSRNDLKEIGAEHGAWVVPTDLLNATSTCYCIGCGEDISFDIGLIEQFCCDVFAFDPTPRAVRHVERVAAQNTQYHFFEIGLWDKEDNLKFYVPKHPEHVSHSLLNLQNTDDYIVVRVKRLKCIMKEIGHNKIDLLKIDIEGAEYRVIESIIEDNIHVKVICVEYDECFNPLDGNYKLRIRASVNGLVAMGYALVAAQGNGNYTFVRGDR